MRKPCCFVFSAAIACLTLAFAQTSAGVNGFVLDSSRAVMPDTQVTIINLETGAKREATTNESGGYQFTFASTRPILHLGGPPGVQAGGTAFNWR